MELKKIDSVHCNSISTHDEYGTIEFCLKESLTNDNIPLGDAPSGYGLLRCMFISKFDRYIRECYLHFSILDDKVHGQWLTGFELDALQLESVDIATEHGRYKLPDEFLTRPLVFDDLGDKSYLNEFKIK